MEKPHSYGSFNYKVIHPNIKQILRARSELDNTVQMAMPFAKATTTIGGDQLPEYLGTGNIGFTLGLHAYAKDIEYQDMYGKNGGDGQYPLIGYSYTAGGTNELIYAKPPDIQATVAAQFFDQGSMLKNTSDFGRIPPPGITQVKIGRNKNGLLAYGEIDFVVPSLIQLEFLHRVFLIPGCGMVLEWGQQFAAETNPSIGEFNPNKPMQDYMFPWYDRTKLKDMLTKLAKRQIGMETILRDYVYPTQGQYMWMFGRIANFSTKANSDGSFNCNIKIVGPSEDAWAYSTRTTVLPAVDKTNQVCEATSIEQYFVTTAPSKKNLKSLLDGVINKTILPEWEPHVQFFPQGNKPEPPEDDDQTKATKKEEPNTDQSSFADSEDAYFFTWRFFVNVVVNNEDYGIKSIFKSNLGEETMAKISLLRPYADGPTQTPLMDKPGPTWLNDPIEPFVGRNKYLRSIDPSTMIIVHEVAAAEAAKRLQNDRPSINKELSPPTDITGKFHKVGDFKESINQAAAEDSSIDTNNPDRGFLSCGVWLNHKGVVQALAGSETFLRGVVNLLERMNSATIGFWQLTLDNFEPIDAKDDSGAEVSTESDNKFDYLVIDANWRGSSEDAVKKAIDGGENGEPGLYIFNKYARTDPRTGKLVGSELIDSNVDLKLPKLLFSQIATLGLVQKQDLASAGAPGLEAEADKKAPLISDPNEALRRMFAITTLSVKSDGTQGPDLTILPYGENLTQVCGQANSQTTANTAGSGQRIAGQTTDSLKDKSKEEIEQIQKDADAYVKDPSNQCSQCGQSFTQTTQSPTTATTPTTATPTTASPAPATSSPVIPIDSNNPLPAPNTPPYIPDSTSPTPLKPVKESWAGRRLPATRTVLSFDQMCKELKALGCSKTMAISIMATMMVEQGGGGEQFKGWNNNFAGVDITHGGWNFNPQIHNGYTVLKDGGSGTQHAFAAFRSARASLAFKKEKFDKRGFGNVTDAASYARLYYEKWNGFGFRTITSVQGPLGVKATQIRNAGNKVNAPYGTPAWAEIDAAAIKNATAAYNKIAAKIDQCYGATPSTQTPPPQPPPAQPTPAPATPAQPTPIQPAPAQPTVDCTKCNQNAEIVRQASKQLDIISVKDKLMREFPYLKELFRYIEPFPDVMTAQIRGSSDDTQANAFGAAPGALSISAELTMPGINGIRVGELFWIDRIPTFYRAFGAFQVLSIEDTISLDGWKTQISSRFNYLGTIWKTRTAEFLTKAGAPPP